MSSPIWLDEEELHFNPELIEKGKSYPIIWLGDDWILRKNEKGIIDFFILVSKR